MASNVPKFASFRPKPKPDTRLRQESREGGQVDQSSKTNAPVRDQSAKERLSSKTYFSDRRGDPQILRYACLSSYDIPVYRRHGHGCVLGLALHQKIDREGSTDKKLYITPETRPRQERLLTSKRATKSSNRDLCWAGSSQQQLGLDDDFISLSKPKECNNSKSLDVDEPEPDYRGFDHERGIDKPPDSDLQHEADWSAQRIGAAIIRENSALLRRTREHPEDVETWLALIHQQEAMLKLDDPQAELSTVEKAQLALVRIPMYEEALKRISKTEQGHGKLYEGLLREAERAWDEKRVATMWREVIAKHQSSVDLWFVYLDFVQSNFLGFKYDDCCTSFFSCFDALGRTPENVPPETSLHLLLRLTSMMQEAGYQELALATWQAILEFHFMQPPQDDGRSPGTFRPFEDFWESEVPRVGEPGAKGWKTFSKDEAPLSSPPLLHKPDASRPSMKHFEKQESEAVDELRYPGRTADEGAGDDAFHIIFHSDLKAAFQRIPATTPRAMILEAFLCFCGLPPPAEVGSRGSKWWTDPFLQRQFHLDIYSRDDPNQSMQTSHCLSSGLPPGFRMTTEQLFKQDFSLSSIRLGKEFVRRLLQLIVSSASGINWIGEYLLAFELQHFPQQFSKTAKQLIKADPSNARLYSAYGLAESHRGNSAQADQVFSMALSMYSGVDQLSSGTSLELFSNWVWGSLERGEQAKSLWRLASPQGYIPEPANEDLPPDENIISRARTFWRETIESNLLGQNYMSAVATTSLLALLDYLSKKYQLLEALATHQNLSSWFASHKSSNSRYAELHAQAIARLLTYHVTHAPIVKPAIIRSALVPLISLFPENTVLLALYAANESRFSLDDRVRSIMKQTTLQTSDSTNPVGWAFAIRFETVRGEKHGSTSHSIRALYTRAMVSSCRHSPAFWMCYVRFELAQLQQEHRRQRLDEESERYRRRAKRRDTIKEAEQQVKDTFYAGLRNIPWCKDFIMMAFSELKETFEENELRKLYNVMQEKELRLYVEFDMNAS